MTPVEVAKLKYLTSVERLLQEAAKTNENRLRLLELIEKGQQEQRKGDSR
jgi:hypothetical protein